MSTNEILASHLWPWPDPLLKRDHTGAILFINAAFLQLYGGRPDDWHGQMVPGWPAPGTAGAHRFETRAGSGAQENVYDWVETPMADGTTLAIARNVTDIISAAIYMGQQSVTQTAPAPIVTPAQQALPVEQPPQQPLVQQQIVQAVPVEAAPVQAEPAQPIQQQPEQAPEVQTPPVQTPAQPLAQNPVQASSFEDTLTRNADDYSYEEPASERRTEPVAASPDTSAVSVQQNTPQTAQAPASAPKVEEERMTPRRALPIEDSASVLGSNWRDQVIAKAVGAAAPDDEPVVDKIDDIEDAPAPGAGAGLHILLAEDNAINALLTRTLLEAEGAVVDTVEDGALAVEAIKTKIYDLVFMDMRMPNMDGLESTRKIRAQGSKMPIIALTANAFDDDRNACFDSGMNDFMTKPVSAEELIDMVSTWVGDKKEEKLAS